MTDFDFKDRYSRQIRFRHIGETGQARISKSRVAVVGLGALGTASAAQLARAGVGYLRLIDRDVVEPSNLQRQLLYTEKDARNATPKAIAARDALAAANSGITIEAVVDDLDASNAEQLLADVDVVIDGSDNFEVRYLINEVAVKHNIPWAYAGAVEAHGTSAFLRPGRTPCLVCLLGYGARVGHDTCDTVGVISPIVQWMASYQVAEVLKYLAGREDALSNAILQADVWHTDVRLIRMGGPKPDCPCCGRREFVALSAGRRALSVTFCGRQTIQVRPQEDVALSLPALAERLRPLGTVRASDALLRFETGGVALTVFPNGRALVHGTDDPARARSLYAQYIGM